MRDVAVVAFAQTNHAGEDKGLSEVEMLAPIIQQVKQQTGLNRFGFTCSGSCDYLAGAPFSFVSALDAVGAWPPISESHVEMDAAWALYEAWVRLQHDDIDTALVYGFSKGSQPDDLRAIHGGRLDPYYLGPLGFDDVSLAGLQARAFMDRTGTKENDLLAVASRARAAGRDNPYALDLPEPVADAAYVASPLREHDTSPITDGAAAIVLAVGDKARELSEHPAWIRGIDHRIEAHSPGSRDISRSESTVLAAARAGGDGSFDVAELHTVFSHEELLLREALALPDSMDVNPSGGPLSADPVMATGLIRIGEAASRIGDGRAGRAIAHAASGACLQHNLICVLSE